MSQLPAAAQKAVEPTASITRMADDFYFQFSRGDNEAAIELYERVLGVNPDDTAALAGLANALVQRSVRWPELPGEPAVEFSNLGAALKHGHLSRAPALQQLDRAQRLAEHAAVLAPNSAAAHKAVGFVASAQGRFAQALRSYQRCLSLDPEAWGALINIGDVLQISGDDEKALPYFERAYAAMQKAYSRNPVQIRPWHAALGVEIASRYAARGNFALAETWYRRVLAQSPLHPEATRGLAQLLRESGDEASAQQLCAELSKRLGNVAACEAAK